MKEFRSFKPLKPEHGKGAIAIVAPVWSRWTKFWESYSRLLMANTDCDIIFRVGNQLAQARNEAILQAKEKGKDWIFFIDDDHVFDGDIIQRLLAHNVDIVGALYCVRNYPFTLTSRSVKQLDSENGLVNVFDLPASGPPGLHKVMGLGGSGLLIRKKVWNTIPDPWFTVGHGKEDIIAEDFSFCIKAFQHDIDVHLATDVTIPHITAMEVSPHWTGDRWVISLHLGLNKHIHLEYDKKESE